MESKKNNQTVVNFTGNENIECEINNITQKIENTEEYKECFDTLLKNLKLINESGDINFYSVKNIEDLAKYFLKIFDYNDIKKFNPNDIDDRINLTKLHIKNIYDMYHSELIFNMSIVCNIFSIIGDSSTILSDKLSSLIWASKFDPPIYILNTSNASIFPKIVDTTLIEIINKFKNSKIIIEDIPKVISHSNIIKNKCHQITQTIVLDIDDLSTNNQTLNKIISDVKSYESLSNSNAYGLCDDEKDECDENRLINTTKHQENILDNFSGIIRSARDGYYKFHTIILDLIHKITYYKKIRSKINYIINMFNKIVICNLDSNSNLLSQNIIILNIDIILFKFAYSFFIDQIKVDKFDKFSIHRILSNIANYYINNQKPRHSYIIIHEQQQSVRINILLFLYMFNKILSDTESFILPIQYINTINIAYIVGMTNRKNIICPSNDIQQQIIKNIISTTSYHDQIIYTYKGNNIIVDKYGYEIKFTIDTAIRHVQLLNI